MTEPQAREGNGNPMTPARPGGRNRRVGQKELDLSFTRVSLQAMSTPQSVLDALSDAETLRQAWRLAASEYPGVAERFRLEYMTTARLWQAGLLGHYLSWECADSARDAARVAFRAVPGLRA
jgi:hypothetical protein